MNAEVKNYSSRSADKFVVRLPKGMRDRISLVAKNYHRSMNSEIVSRLENSLSHEFDLQNSGIENSSDDIVELEVSPSEKELITRLRALPSTKLDAILELIK